MSSVASEKIARPQPAPETACVVNWPLRDGGVGAWLMALSLLGAAVAAGYLARDAWMGVACLAALALAAWRLWIPVTFEFRSKGVICRVLGRAQQIPWSQIARYEVKPSALTLFADSDDTPLAALRSTCIYWNGKREEIVRVVEYYMQARVSAASTQAFVKQGSES